MLKQIRQLLFSLIVLVVTMLVVSQWFNDVSALPNTARLSNERPPSLDRSNSPAISLHIGNGPFGPPEDTDSAVLDRHRNNYGSVSFPR